MEAQEPLNKEFTHSWVILNLFLLVPPYDLSPNYVDSTSEYLSIHLRLSTLIATTCFCTSPMDLGIGYFLTLLSICIAPHRVFLQHSVIMPHLSLRPS